MFLFRKSIAQKLNVFFILFFETFIIVTAIIMGIQAGDPYEFFKEAGFVSWLSFAQLLLIAGFCSLIPVYGMKKIFFIFKKDSLVWLIFSFGFLLLGFDERFLIHEQLDKMIHKIFSLKETGFTDMIDDILVAFYGVAAIFIFYYFWKELKKYSEVFPYILFGIIFFIIMVVLDIATNKPGQSNMIIDQKESLFNLHNWLAVIEDSCKIYTEGFFLIAGSLSFQISRENNT